MFCHMEPYSKNKIVFHDFVSEIQKTERVKVEINVIRVMCFQFNLMLTL
jgi:hypothetical protein